MSELDRVHICVREKERKMPFSMPFMNDDRKVLSIEEYHFFFPLTILIFDINCSLYNKDTTIHITIYIVSLY